MEEEQPPQLQRNFSQDHPNFLINAGILLKEFDCTICFCPIEDCHVTRCGHVFCKECILEAINRHHRCPFCQSELNDQDVFKNYHFINMKKLILDEKQKQEEQYLKKTYQFENNSPLEGVFQKYLSKMILLYHNKFKETQQRCDQAQEKLRHNLELQTQKILNENNQMENEDKIKQLTEQFDIQTQELKHQVDIINDFYIQSLENSLKKAVPDPEILDVRVSLTIPNKNIRVESMYIKPNSFIQEFNNYIEGLFLRKNDPIMDINQVKNEAFLIKISPENIKNTNIDDFKQLNYDEFCQQIQDIKPFKLNSQDLFVNMKIEQGCQIVVLGTIKTNNDRPPECMTYTFKKENPVVLDYFSCKDCGINWVCPGCKDHCHKGHNIQPYIAQHNATWACCYCASKTKKCTALNKFQKK